MTTKVNVLQQCGLISLLTELEAQRRDAWARIGKSFVLAGLCVGGLVAILR